MPFKTKDLLKMCYLFSAIFGLNVYLKKRSRLQIIYPLHSLIFCQGKLLKHSPAKGLYCVIPLKSFGNWALKIYLSLKLRCHHLPRRWACSWLIKAIYREIWDMTQNSSVHLWWNRSFIKSLSRQLLFLLTCQKMGRVIQYIRKVPMTAWTGQLRLIIELTSLNWNLEIMIDHQKSPYEKETFFMIFGDLTSWFMITFHDIWWFLMIISDFSW